MVAIRATYTSRHTRHAMHVTPYAIDALCGPANVRHTKQITLTPL